jgi:hypothetical protein
MYNRFPLFACYVVLVAQVYVDVLYSRSVLLTDEHPNVSKDSENVLVRCLALSYSPAAARFQLNSMPKSPNAILYTQIRRN